MTRRTVSIPRPEVLIAHAGFIRSVAQRLLLDDHEVDDVVQQTLVAALEKPPRRALKPWLAAVARNLARMRRRTEGRLHRRERDAARPESVTATSEIAERLDMQRKVVEAVTSLDAKYRDVVVLRFFDELPPREVAARLDLPVETVRTRTRRALEQLRTELDGHEGGRPAWRLALLPLALPPRAAQAVAGTAAAGILGAIGMKSILALAGALLAAVVFLWSEAGGDDGVDVLRANETRTANAPGVIGPDGVGRAPKADGDVPAETPPDTPRDFLFRAVVVDPEGEPVRGATAVGQVRGHNQRDVELRTNADGVIEIDGRAGDRDAVVKLEHEDFVAENAFLAAWTDETERIVLERGHELRVRVLSPAGEPVAGAPYIAMLREARDGPVSYWSRDLEGESGGDGVVDLGRVGRIDLKLQIDDSRHAYYEREFPADDLADGEVTATLETGGTIRGRVLDPEGEPLAGATVKSSHRAATTDGDGRFVLAHVSTDGVVVSAEHPDYAPSSFGEAVGWRRNVPVHVANGAEVTGIDIRLGPASRVTGRVVDAAGEPVAGFEVNSYCFGGYSKAAAPKTGEDGRFVAGPWNLDKPATWRVNRTKTETHHLSKEIEFELKPGQTLDVGDLVVDTRPGVRFRVTMPDGSPVPPRLKAEIHMTVTRRHEERAWNDFLFANRSVFPVKPDGTYDMHLDRAVYTLRAKAEGGLHSKAEVVDAARLDGDEIVLALRPTVPVSGHLRGAGGAPAAGTALVMLPAEAEVPWKPGTADRVVTGPEGEFTFHVAEPGDYRIGVAQNASNTEQEFAAAPEPRRVTVGSQPIEGLQLDLIRERKGAVVRGQIVSAATGRPVAQASLAFVRYKLLFPQHTLMTSSWDRDGRFEEVLDTPGTYAVTVRADGHSAITTAKFEVKEKGEVDLGTLRLPPPIRLTGTVVDARGTPVEYAQVHLLNAGGHLRNETYTDTTGSFVVEQPSAGIVNIFAVSPRHPVAVLRGVTISRDGPNRIEIPLPPASPLTVKVTDENGQPVEGAEFVYTFPAVAPFTSEEFGGFEPPSYGANESDAEGYVRKPYMPAARLTLRISKEGFVPVQRIVDTKKGEPVELEIVLKRAN